MKGKHVTWKHLGTNIDIKVYHTGGTVHYLEARYIENHRLIEKRKFQTDARVRAIARANEILTGHDEVTR